MYIRGSATHRFAILIGSNSAGIPIVAPPCATVSAGDPVLILHHRGGRGLDEALPLLDEAIGIGDGPFEASALVVEEIRG